MNANRQSFFKKLTIATAIGAIIFGVVLLAQASSAVPFAASPKGAAIATAAINSAATNSAVTNSAVQDVDDNGLAAAIQATAGPIVVEFYDPTDPDPSGECARQRQIYEDTARQYVGRVTFLRFDARQNPAMIEAGRLGVCPTHLFVLDRFPNPEAGHVPNRTPFRHWGLTTQSQFQELIEEFFNIKP